MFSRFSLSPIQAGLPKSQQEQGSMANGEHHTTTLIRTTKSPIHGWLVEAVNFSLSEVLLVVYRRRKAQEKDSSKLDGLQEKRSKRLAEPRDSAIGGRKEFSQL